MLERIQAIASRTGHTMEDVEVQAKASKLQTENIQEWSEGDIQSLRDRLYAFYPDALKAFGSSDAAGAEYQAFLKDGNVDFSDDGAVWSAWSAIAA